MRAVQAAMERAVGESALRLESKMIVLSTAVSRGTLPRSPRHRLGRYGCLCRHRRLRKCESRRHGTGYFPGSLITTIISLLVAIPAMFGYNFLVTTLRSLLVQADNFATEFSSEIEHRFVEFGHREPRRPLI
jgi:hypothetical protein